MKKILLFFLSVGLLASQGMMVAMENDVAITIHQEIETDNESSCLVQAGVNTAALIGVTAEVPFFLLHATHHVLTFGDSVDPFDFYLSFGDIKKILYATLGYLKQKNQ